MIECKICYHIEKANILPHLKKVHNMKGAEYKKIYSANVMI